MKTARLLLICVAIIISGSLFAQKIKVQSGKLSALNGIKKIKIEYDYSDLGVGKFDKEEDYIAKRVSEMNENEAGTGDTWKENWFKDREERYEPKFEELFAKYTEPIESGKDIESKIIMNVHTIFIEPGFNVGITRRPSLINQIITITKEEKELVVISMDKCPGSDVMGADFDTGWRISEAYAKAGKSFGKYLKKYMK
jgi:hypothetical protein